MRNIFNKMIFILFLFMVDKLYAQSCRELYEKNTARAIQLYVNDASMAQWLDIRDEMKKLNPNACEGEFTDDEKRNILEHLIEICKRVSDFKQYFTYRDELLQLMGDSTNAIVLEEVAKLAYRTINLSKTCGKITSQSLDLLDKHFLRKHGDKKYYGQ